MLRDSLYTCHSLKIDSRQVTSIITVNPQHEVFGGHFPGRPILPGVCALQIVKEIFESQLDQKLELVLISNLKFLEIIDPNVVDRLKIIIDYNDADELVVMKARIEDDEFTYYKFSGSYRSAK